MAYVVTVTGASGYIGTELTKQLLEKGYTVRATVRDKLAAEKVIPPLRWKVMHAYAASSTTSNTYQ